MSKHTKGPWHSGKGANTRYTVYDKFSQRVGDFFEGVMVTQRSSEECAANARLGAAAPDLLADLRAAANYIDTLGGDSRAYRQTIAKAEEGE